MSKNTHTQECLAAIEARMPELYHAKQFAIEAFVCDSLLKGVCVASVITDVVEKLKMGAF